MRWLLLVCILLFSAPYSAFSQQGLLPEPMVIEPTLTLSQTLDELALKLETALTDSQSDWDLLSQVLMEHSTRLAQLVMLSKDYEQEIASIRKSLTRLETSLMLTKKEVSRQKLYRNLAIGAAVLALGTGGYLGWRIHP